MRQENRGREQSRDNSRTDRIWLCKYV